MVTRIGENPGYVPDPEEEIHRIAQETQETVLYFGGKDPDETDQLIEAYNAQMKNDFTAFAKMYPDVTPEAVTDLARVTKIEAWVDLTFWKRDKHAAAKRLEEKIKQKIVNKINRDMRYQGIYFHFLEIAEKLLPLNERVDMDSHEGMAEWRTARMLKKLVPERKS